jgi:hypothetical protein
MSALTIEPVAVPLQQDPTGGIRVGESHVSLEASQPPSLDLRERLLRRAKTGEDERAPAGQ